MEKCILMLVLNFLFLFSVSAQQNQETTTNENADRRSAQQNQKDSKDDDAKRNNFFLGLGVKGDVFMNDDALHDSEVLGHPSLGGNVFVGKWFNRYLGSRIVFEYGKLKPSFQRRRILEDENYGLGRLDLILDLTNCFPLYTSNRIYNLMPYIGVGGAFSMNAKSRPDGADHSSSFLFGGGLWNSFRLSDKLSVYLNIGLDLVDAGFDGWKDKRKYDGIAALSVGMIYNF